MMEGMKASLIEKAQSYDRISVYRFICVLVALSVILGTGLVIIKPFLPALFLGLILTLATWHPFIWLEKRLEGRTTLAAAIMTLTLAVGFIIPLFVLGASLVDNFNGLSTSLTDALQAIPQTPPAWLSSIPLVSEAHADHIWANYVADTAFITDQLKAHVGPMSEIMLKVGASVGRGLVDLSLGILIAFFFFRHGLAAMRHLKVLLDKFFGLRARHLLNVSKNTMIGVIYGLLGTALAQATVAGIGYWIAHVPGPVFLAFLTFVLSPAPVGAPAIWIPVAIWLLAHHKIGMAMFIVAWGIFVVGVVDNIVRPWFISRGSEMPFSLMLLGLCGGIISFGFIGIFIGPTVLAVIYTLLLEWSKGKPAPAAEESPIIQAG
jgi:predicted PurR-regulated permease PerM